MPRPRCPGALLACLLACCFAGALAQVSRDSGNVSVPANDPRRPGCVHRILWAPVFAQGNFITYQTQCGLRYHGTRILPVQLANTFATVVKEKTKLNREIEFFVQEGQGRYCGLASLSITRPMSFTGQIAWQVRSGSFECNRDEMIRITHLVCTKTVCPAPTTTSTTTTTAAPTTSDLSTVAVGAQQLGAFGLSLDSELMLWRCCAGVLAALLLLLIMILIHTCVKLRGANEKRALMDGRSHVSIRRVTEPVVDPYSSMAGIAETSSMGGPEIYGSIARRKELSRDRERKAWLRDHSYAGSAIGVPPPEDMNGLLPPHGSVHRTSITSLTQGGHNGSLSRVPGVRGPPGTYPVRPSACQQLSRQNTVDSIHYRPIPAPSMLPPSPGVNGGGHANPLGRDEMEGHMV